MSNSFEVLRGNVTVISQYLSIVVQRDLCCYFSKKATLIHLFADFAEKKTFKYDKK